MVDVVRRNQLPAAMMVTDRFGGGLGPATYSAYMENSRFALAPRGHAEETIRLFDAMELGAIPISLRHEFLRSRGVGRRAGRHPRRLGTVTPMARSNGHEAGRSSGLASSPKAND